MHITLDGRKINIYANIGSVDHVGAALFNDAGGIGLFRSEFLYLERGDYPSEKTQFDAYKRVLECMGGRKVIIRTLDIGADKKTDYFSLPREENPALGMRAIRICLARREMFKTQQYETTHVYNYMKSAPAYVYIDEKMDSVMRKFEQTEAWNLPVVDSEGTFVGFIRKSSVLAVYRQMMADYSTD